MEKINDIVSIYTDIEYKLLTHSPAYTVGYIHAIRDGVYREKNLWTKPVQDAVLNIFAPFCHSREYKPEVLKNQVVRALKQLEALELCILTGLVSDVAEIVFAYRQDL